MIKIFFRESKTQEMPDLCICFAAVLLRNPFDGAQLNSITNFWIGCHKNEGKRHVQYTAWFNGRRVKTCEGVDGLLHDLYTHDMNTYTKLRRFLKKEVRRRAKINEAWALYSWANSK